VTFQLCYRLVEPVPTLFCFSESSVCWKLLTLFRMKLLYKRVALAGLIFLGCKDEKMDIAEGTPACVVNEIANIKKEAKWNPPAKVFSYQYKGQTVYYIPPRCCDIPSTLLNANCTVVCAPDGGISGGGDGKCPDFFTARSAEKLIWQDSR